MQHNDVINETNCETWVTYFKELLYKHDQIMLTDIQWDSQDISNDHVDFCHQLISIVEIMKSINELKDSKSTGIDGIASECPNMMSQYIEMLFNELLN